MKEQILGAVRRLIDAGTLPSAITIKLVIATGICTQKEFSAHFPDLLSLQLEMAQTFFSEARERVIHDTEGLQVGLQQLSAAFVSYLDFNLERPQLQELAHHIQYTPAGFELLMRMEAGVALIIQADLVAMNAHFRTARAQLLTTMAVMVVRAEYQSKKKISDLREALMDYCQRSAD
jgi:hypothetical protein